MTSSMHHELTSLIATDALVATRVDPTVQVIITWMQPFQAPRGETAALLQAAVSPQGMRVPDATRSHYTPPYNHAASA